MITTEDDMQAALLDIARFTRMLMSRNNRAYDTGCSQLLKRKAWRDYYCFFIVGLEKSGKLNKAPEEFERLTIEIQGNPHYQEARAIPTAMPVVPFDTKSASSKSYQNDKYHESYVKLLGLIQREQRLGAAQRASAAKLALTCKSFPVSEVGARDYLVFIKRTFEEIQRATDVLRQQAASVCNSGGMRY